MRRKNEKCVQFANKMNVETIEVELILFFFKKKIMHTYERCGKLVDDTFDLGSGLWDGKK